MSELPLLQRSLGRAIVAGLAATVAVAVGRLTGLTPSAPGDAVLGILAGAVGWLATARDAVGEAQRASGFGELQRELDRARRHRRPFALLRFSVPDRDRALLVGVMDGVDREIRAVAGTSLRITDRAWLDDDDVVVLLPEADRTSVTALVARLDAVAAGAPVRHAVAVFPDDGLTSGALLAALAQGAGGAALPSPISPMPAGPGPVTEPGPGGAGDDIAATVG
jgi:hypothetical protein